MEAFARLAVRTDASLGDVALALAAEFRPVDVAAAHATLAALGEEVAVLVGRSGGSPTEQLAALRRVLADAHGFAGDAERYDDPANSMLDVVLERRRGLPILLSALYVDVARRAGIPLVGVGLPGHYVAGHFESRPPLLIDPFNGGALVRTDAPDELVRPWSSADTALRMLNNLVPAFRRRGDVGAAIRAAELRLELPVDTRRVAEMRAELLSLRAMLN